MASEKASEQQTSNSSCVCTACGSTFPAKRKPRRTAHLVADVRVINTFNSSSNLTGLLDIILGLAALRMGPRATACCTLDKTKQVLHYFKTIFKETGAGPEILERGGSELFNFKFRIDP